MFYPTLYLTRIASLSMLQRAQSWCCEYTCCFNMCPGSFYRRTVKYHAFAIFQSFTQPLKAQGSCIRTRPICCIVSCLLSMWVATLLWCKISASRWPFSELRRRLRLPTYLFHSSGHHECCSLHVTKWLEIPSLQNHNWSVIPSQNKFDPFEGAWCVVVDLPYACPQTLILWV